MEDNISDGDGSLTQEEIAEYLYTLVREDPWVFFVSLLSTLAILTVFMVFVILGVSRAGRFSPPVVVITIVLGIVALMALITYALQPDNEALGQVVAAAVGGLAGALGTAFAERKFVEKELEYVKQQYSNQSESDGGISSSSDSVGDLDPRYGDMARHVHGDSDSSTNGSDSNDSGIRSGVSDSRSTEKG